MAKKTKKEKAKTVKTKPVESRVRPIPASVPVGVPIKTKVQEQAEKAIMRGIASYEFPLPVCPRCSSLKTVKLITKDDSQSRKCNACGYVFRIKGVKTDAKT